MFSEFSWESLNILFCCSSNISEYPLWVFSTFCLNLDTIRLNLLIHIAPAGQMEIILSSICDCSFSKFSHFAEFQFLARVFTVVGYPRVLLHFYIIFLLSVLFKFHSRHHALLTVIDWSEHTYGWLYLETLFISKMRFYYQTRLFPSKSRNST